MRELKFRYVYEDKKSGKIIKEILRIEDLECGRSLHVDNNNFKILSRDQFTGLKDSKGVEIYEGDFIALDPFHFPDDTFSPNLVSFKDGSSVRHKKKDVEMINAIILSQHELGFMKEIIVGNIHEGIVD